MKKFIDSEGFKSFLKQLKVRIDGDAKRTSYELDNYKKILGVGKLDLTDNPYDRITDLYNILGIDPWQNGQAPTPSTELTGGLFSASSIQGIFIELYSEIGKSYDSASESGSAFAIINYLKEKLGESYAEAGTDSAFARIKKLETTVTTTDELAEIADMDYLFDLYVNHDASTISAEDKNAIITTIYESAGKPDYLD